MYRQDYDPVGNAALSTILAAVPIVTLLYFIALHPHRDGQGVLVAGGVFAIVQVLSSGNPGFFLLTDVMAGVTSVVAVILFLRGWRPKRRFLLRRERTQVTGGLGTYGPGAMAATATPEQYRYPFSLNQTLQAWVPWALYPFFAACLSWLGVFLTGSDKASNALFGSLQRATAEQLNINPILTVATNSTGGVMGKIIDAHSITRCHRGVLRGSDARRERAGTDFLPPIPVFDLRSRIHRSDGVDSGPPPAGRDPGGQLRLP